MLMVMENQWVAQFLREHGYTYTISYDEVINELWNEAIALSGEDVEFPIGFFDE